MLDDIIFCTMHNRDSRRPMSGETIVVAAVVAVVVVAVVGAPLSYFSQRATKLDSRLTRLKTI